MIKLINDDCLKAMKDMPDESIDCVVTDCPYRIINGGNSNKNDEPGGIFNKRVYEKGDDGKTYLKGTKHVSLNGIFNDNNLYVRQGKLFKYNDIKFSEWLPELYRICKPKSHIYIYISARNLKELQNEAEKVGFKFQNIIIWKKNNSTPNKYYLNSYEMILMLRKGKAKNINRMGTKNILEIKNIIGNKTHPTEKPVELNKILIENSTNENEIVFDPFMGTGSCGIACKELNRNFIGIELDEKYFKIAKERIEKEGRKFI